MPNNKKLYIIKNNDTKIYNNNKRISKLEGFSTSNHNLHTYIVVDSIHQFSSNPNPKRSTLTLNHLLHSSLRHSAGGIVHIDLL